jgi:transcriptional accessory protein Tex/SPT6
VIKKFLDYLANENNGALYALALQSIAPYMEDSETVNSFADHNGISVLTKLLTHDDNNVKKQAAHTFVKALKNERNQISAKDSGVIPILASQIAGSDSVVAISAAMSLSGLAKNEANLLALVKLGVVESFFKYIQGEEKEARRECLGALASFANHAKVRNRIRNSLENIALIVKMIGLDDPSTIVNACDCVIMMSEDQSLRVEFVKSGALLPILTVLDLADTKIQCSGCLALSRLLSEGWSIIII